MRFREWIILLTHICVNRLQWVKHAAGLIFSRQFTILSTWYTYFVVCHGYMPVNFIHMLRNYFTASVPSYDTAVWSIWVMDGVNNDIATKTLWHRMKPVLLCNYSCWAEIGFICNFPIPRWDDGGNGNYILLGAVAAGSNGTNKGQIRKVPVHEIV